MSRSQPRNFFDAMWAPSRSTLNFSQTIEGWIRLAVFAVVDDIDTELGLLAHDFADCLAQPCGVAGLTESLGAAFCTRSRSPGGGTAQQTASYFDEEAVRWKNVITSAHVTLD